MRLAEEVCIFREAQKHLDFDVNHKQSIADKASLDSLQSSTAMHQDLISRLKQIVCTIGREATSGGGRPPRLPESPVSPKNSGFKRQTNSVPAPVPGLPQVPSSAIDAVDSLGVPMLSYDHSGQNPDELAVEWKEHLHNLTECVAASAESIAVLEERCASLMELAPGPRLDRLEVVTARIESQMSDACSLSHAIQDLLSDSGSTGAANVSLGKGVPFATMIGCGIENVPHKFPSQDDTLSMMKSRLEAVERANLATAAQLANVAHQVASQSLVTSFLPKQPFLNPKI